MCLGDHSSCKARYDVIFHVQIHFVEAANRRPSYHSRDCDDYTRRFYSTHLNIPATEMQPLDLKLQQPTTDVEVGCNVML